MKNKFLVLWMLALALSTFSSHAQTSKTVFPEKEWQLIAKPEDKGFSSAQLQAAKNYADTIKTAAVMVHRVNTDLKDTAVSDAEFGTLVNLILKAQINQK